MRAERMLQLLGFAVFGIGLYYTNLPLVACVFLASGLAFAIPTSR